MGYSKDAVNSVDHINHERYPQGTSAVRACLTASYKLSYSFGMV